MLHQPTFGRRLRQLRLERGLSQAALGGSEISAAYLSRLESGSRPPTPRVAGLLAGRLGVAASAFEDRTGPSVAALLAELHSDAQPHPDRAKDLDRALRTDEPVDPAVRWQALWAMVEADSALPGADADLEGLAELVDVAHQVGVPELVCRSEALYSRRLRMAGQYVDARVHALRALQALDGAEEPGHPDTGDRGGAGDGDAPPADAQTGGAGPGGPAAAPPGPLNTDRALALTALVAAEGDEGRLDDARAHAEELLRVVEGECCTVVARALWSNATVRFLQGEHAAAAEFMRRAVERADAREDLTLWIRVRLASASLHLHMAPADIEHSRAQLTVLAPVLDLLGEPQQVQEFRALEAHLALADGDLERARQIADRLLEDPSTLLLSHRDRVRLDTVRGRTMILSGDRQAGVRHLEELAEGAGAGALSLEVFRVLAATLSASLDHIEHRV